MKSIASLNETQTMRNSPEPFASSHKSMNHPMPPPRISRGSFENIRFSGRNIGASMAVDGGGSGESAGSCSINIYINNDVQGINNCVLIGSEVKMGDPGVRVWLDEVKMDRGFRMVNKNKVLDSAAFWVLLVAFLVLIVSILAYIIL